MPVDGSQVNLTAAAPSVACRIGGKKERSGKVVRHRTGWLQDTRFDFQGARSSFKIRINVYDVGRAALQQSREDYVRAMS